MWRVLLNLAVRNIFRNRRRTILTFFAIASGMASIIVFGGFVSYTYFALREQTIHSQLGHLNIFKSGYSAHPGDASKYFIDDFDKVDEQIKSVPGVRSVTARLGFSALISTGEKTMNCLATGVIPGREEELSNAESILAGHRLGAADTNGLVLGSLLAQSLGVKPGDTVTILTTTASGMINARDLQIAGIARVGSKEYDRVFVKLPLDIAQNLLNTKQVERAVVLLDKTSDTARVEAVLKDKFAAAGLPLEIRTWEDLADFYQAVVRLYGGIFRVVNLIIAALFLFGIANTLTMSIFERVREIGTLRAIGTRREGVRNMFLWEGLVMGLAGGVIGIFAGLITAFFINVAGGFYIPPPPGMSDGYQAFISVDWKTVLYAFLLTVAVATVSSLYPALRASKLNIVQALGHT